jgi:hypothetical protein
MITFMINQRSIKFCFLRSQVGHSLNLSYDVVSILLCVILVKQNVCLRVCCHVNLLSRKKSVLEVPKES